MRQLSGIDAMFLHAETEAMPLHVCGLVVLDPAGCQGDPAAAIERAFAERLHLVPPFMLRVVFAPGNLDHPWWVEDASFDLTAHLHRVRIPGPGGRRELEELVSRVAGTPLDRDRPLWECWIIEGLAGGQVALFTKVHHAIMDGAAGGEVMAALFDLVPDAPPPPPPPAVRRTDTVPASQLLAVDSLVTRAARLTRAPAEMLRLGTRLLELRRARREQRRPDGEIPPISAPRSPLNGRLTPHRVVSFAILPMAGVKAVKEAFGTTVNDVVLALAAGALRASLHGRGMACDEPLVAAVPIALRDRPREVFGNAVGTTLVSLPVDIDDPLERLLAARAYQQEGKALAGAVGPDLLVDMAEVVPGPAVGAFVRLYDAGLSDYVKPWFNLVVSNVPGPPVPLWFAGLRVVAVHPLGPVMLGSGINVTVLSAIDDLHVGVIACPELVPDAVRIADGFAESLTELLEMIGHHSSTSREA